MVPSRVARADGRSGMLFATLNAPNLSARQGRSQRRLCYDTPSARLPICTRPSLQDINKSLQKFAKSRNHAILPLREASMASKTVLGSAQDMESVYAGRLQRYVTALRNEQPDRVPIRPFVAEFTGRYAGYTCQELAHDYEKAFAAARRCAADFDWDAVVSNMVYVWTGLTQAIGLRYYGIPGIDIPADRGFQYIEPPSDKAFMRPDEYDQLIEDPTGFLFNVWLPRVSKSISAPGEPSTELARAWDRPSRRR